MTRVRIQAPVNQETYEAYKALADVQRTSVAAVCGEILEQTAPMIRQMANALEMAKTAPSRALRDMNEALDKLVVDANQMQIDLEDRVTPKATRRKYTKKAS